MTETNRSHFKKRAAALAVASCLSLAPWAAEAAGLGKLTVYSGLGQPLRAEVEIGANRDELVGMTARLAPADAFKQAGLDFQQSLYDLRFAVEKRASGQSVVKVTSVKPINEPFLDFLVELNWPAGRLLREYTFLLDPPEIAPKGAGQQVSVAEAQIVDSLPGGGAAVSRKAPARQAPPAATAEPKKAAAGTRVVQPGETLRKIAGETQYQGVSLEQMLVGLYRNNPDAFIGRNINRLKAGAILGIPDQDSVAAVTEGEAKKVYVTQAGDWGAYRQKLAAASAKAPAHEDAGGQSASGKIAAKLEEKTAPADQSRDQVKVARSDLPAKGKPAGPNEADQIAKDKALKEAQDRLALLEKNVGELQKLVEMKTQKLAELQQQAAGKKDEPKAPEAAKPVEAIKPLEAPKPVEAAKPAEAVKPVEPVAEAPKPAEEAKPVEAAKPVPAPVAKKPLPPPEPEEPSLVDSLLEDPLPLAGGAAILALLGGYFVVRRRRGQAPSMVTTTAPGPSSLGPNSVFRMTGGQSVDTGNTPPQTGDFSQTGPGTIDTDEVDPVAEADVYMAYGRDTQAEEILLEALQKDPQRTAIHAKLLEIYANRRSVKQFDTLASELYAQTGGVGQEWEKVAALGAALDPANPLYSAARAAMPGAFDADATMIATPEMLAKSTVAMPSELPQALEPEFAPDLPSETPAVDSALSFDIPLDVPLETSTPEPAVIEPAPESADDLMSLDFDLGAPVAEPEPSLEPAPPEASVFEELAVDLEPVAEAAAIADTALDFDLGVPDTAVATPVEPEQDVGELHVAEDLGDLDFGLVESTAIEPPAAAKPEPEVDESLEGTQVVGNAMAAAMSTYIGPEIEATDKPDEGAAPVVEELPPMVDLATEADVPATETLISPLTEQDATATMVNPLAIEQYDFEAENPRLAETSVNPNVVADEGLDFDVKLTDSVFLGQPMQPDFDIGSISLDLAVPEAPVAEAPPPAAPEAAAAAPAVHDAVWEEANTKLDLAKAYEEMGDLEGARELLQEVIGDGPADLVEQARGILGRIG